MLPLELVSIENEVPKTTSLVVAEFFSKQHKNVIRIIDNLDCSDKFSQLNFEPSEYTDDRGKVRRMYHMTKNGFIFLVMGFTGKAAAGFKEIYITEFDRMSNFISERQNGLMFRYNKLTLTYNNIDRSASDAGRDLNHLGKIAKPELLKQLHDVEKKMQLRLNFDHKKADTVRQDEMSANQSTNNI